VSPIILNEISDLASGVARGANRCDGFRPRSGRSRGRPAFARFWNRCSSAAHVRRTAWPANRQMAHSATPLDSRFGRKCAEYLPL